MPIPYSRTQLDVLEDSFRTQDYLTVNETKRLGKITCLSDAQLRNWFKNRRRKYGRFKRNRGGAICRIPPTCQTAEVDALEPSLDAVEPYPDTSVFSNGSTQLCLKDPASGSTKDELKGIDLDWDLLASFLAADTEVHIAPIPIPIPVIDERHTFAMPRLKTASSSTCCPDGGRIEARAVRLDQLAPPAETV